MCIHGNYLRHFLGLETCSKDWKKVGCFHDYIHPERPLKFELLNRRDPFSDNYDGHLIDWKDYRGTLHAYVPPILYVTDKGRRMRRWKIDKRL